MPALRVLFVVRPDCEKRIGGDIVMANRTAAALRDLGCDVDIAATASPDPRGYDVVHIFGVFDPPLASAQFASCKGSGVPIALTPIWWDNTEARARSEAIENALTKSERSIPGRLRRIRETSPERLLSRRERKLAAQRKAQQRQLMLQAQVLLPNSMVEAYRYNCDLDVQHRLVHIVPMGANEVPDAPPVTRSGVLCVGRVESRKNQAMLMYALRDLDIEITLRGECYDAYYERLCRRWGTRVRFVGEISRPEVYVLMRAALVHALPAWWETPGLASMEAAMAGCAIVAGNRGTEYEYFGNGAWYCDPGNEESIRNAVLAALETAKRGVDSALSDRLKTLTWANAAQKTLAAYAQITS